MYYVEDENNYREVLKLAEHRVSVACPLNLLSDRLEDNEDPEDSVSQASASSARLKAAA